MKLLTDFPVLFYFSQLKKEKKSMKDSLCKMNHATNILCQDFNGETFKKHKK